MAAAVIAIPTPAGSRGPARSRINPPNGATIASASGSAVSSRPGGGGSEMLLSLEKERHGDEAAEQHDIREERRADPGDERGDPDERLVDDRPGGTPLASDTRRTRGGRRGPRGPTMVHSRGVRLRRQRERGETRPTGSPPAAPSPERRSGSRCRGACSSAGGTIRGRDPTRPIGTLTRKINRHPPSAVSAPPSTGPSVSPTACAAPWIPSPVPSFESGGRRG